MDILESNVKLVCLVSICMLALYTHVPACENGGMLHVQVYIASVPTVPITCSKNKMLKDVGMTVPKVDNKCQVNKQVQNICSKTGDEGNIYAARQEMRAIYMQQDRG